MLLSWKERICPWCMSTCTFKLIFLFFTISYCCCIVEMEPASKHFVDNVYQAYPIHKNNKLETCTVPYPNFLYTNYMEIQSRDLLEMYSNADKPSKHSLQPWSWKLRPLLWIILSPPTLVTGSEPATGLACWTKLKAKLGTLVREQPTVCCSITYHETWSYD